MIFLAFCLPPVALFAMKRWVLGSFVLILWLLSFPALMMFFVPGIALWGISATIAIFCAFQYRIDKQINKITGAIDRVGERFGPPPQTPREVQREEHTHPWMDVFQGGGHDTRVDDILGEPRKEIGSTPTNPVPSVVPTVPAQQNSDIGSVAKLIVGMILIVVMAYFLYELRSGAPDIIHRALNYVTEKKESATVAVLPPPPQPTKPEEPPVPEIKVPDEPVRILGVPGRVTGIRIISAEERPTTRKPWGPTMIGNDDRTGRIYACYLPVSDCEAAFKKESDLEEAARGSQIPTTEITTAPPLVEKKWGHNGSWLKLEMNGARRRFLYTQPRPGLIEEGVTEGMVAFDGEQMGSVLSGTAYVFSRRCGSIGFRVSGEVQSGRITLSGPRPYVDVQCRAVQWVSGVLEFVETD